MPKFEWDPLKNATNKSKHGLTFEDAVLAWNDPRLSLRLDRMEDGEERWHAVGLVGALALIVVVHTYRGEDEDIVRIISARRATTNEREAYYRDNY